MNIRINSNTSSKVDELVSSTGMKKIDIIESLVTEAHYRLVTKTSLVELSQTVRTKHCVYQLTMESGMKYIGATSNLLSRITAHMSTFKNDKVMVLEILFESDCEYITSDFEQTSVQTSTDKLYNSPYTPRYAVRTPIAPTSKKSALYLFD